MAPSPTLTDFTLYFLRLGAIGFGGPIALAGYMQRDLVEVRRWILSWGGNAQVLAPEELAESVREAVRGILETSL